MDCMRKVDFLLKSFFYAFTCSVVGIFVAKLHETALKSAGIIVIRQFKSATTTMQPEQRQKTSEIIGNNVMPIHQIHGGRNLVNLTHLPTSNPYLVNL
ncbi:hypothetical protein PoB_002640800 [Plakobranchus ocellatus]|uniref:Uncharacterized protein n=1 Tax=Plakobranchus ocellatus TaxID=259542 RepID=A0AAV3ZYD7_9GAST|nr:hypothetical protein PoB_002640800 [Plakobranchus ocellatus]